MPRNTPPVMSASYVVASLMSHTGRSRQAKLARNTVRAPSRFVR